MEEESPTNKYSFIVGISLARAEASRFRKNILLLFICSRMKKGEGQRGKKNEGIYIFFLLFEKE